VRKEKEQVQRRGRKKVWQESMEDHDSRIGDVLSQETIFLPPCPHRARCKAHAKPYNTGSTNPHACSALVHFLFTDYHGCSSSILHLFTLFLIRDISYNSVDGRSESWVVADFNDWATDCSLLRLHAPLDNT
jgi:hypothetical protein